MIDSRWGYKEVVDNIETLRNQYNDFLTFFCPFERKKKLILCRNFKKQIYALKFEEFKRNLIWKYINDEIEYEELTRWLKNE